MAFTFPKTKDLQKQWKKLTTSKGSDKSKMELTPFRDWRILVTIFFSGLVGSFVFNAYMFIQINQDSFFSQAAQPAPGTSLNQGGLAQIDKRFTDSANRYNDVLKNGISVVDPSR